MHDIDSNVLQKAFNFSVTCMKWSAAFHKSEPTSQTFQMTPLELLAIVKSSFSFAMKMAVSSPHITLFLNAFQELQQGSTSLVEGLLLRPLNVPVILSTL